MEFDEWKGVDTDPPTRRRTKSYWWSGGFAAARAGPNPRPDALRYV